MVNKRILLKINHMKISLHEEQTFNTHLLWNLCKAGNIMEIPQCYKNNITRKQQKIWLITNVVKLDTFSLTSETRQPFSSLLLEGVDTGSPS